MKILPKSKHSFIEIAFFLICAFILNMSAYYFSRLIASSWYHYDMTLSVDLLIPCVPWTVSIYFISYVFWGVNYYICANTEDKAERNRFFCSDLLAKLICFILFLAIPTTNIRPDVPDSGLWNFLLSFLYSIDAADNLFPSIHCLASWLCWIGVRKRKDIPRAYRYFSLAMAVAICISTLTTKQHVIVDAIGGILIAELCYFVSGLSKIREIYTKPISKILNAFTAEKNNSV